MCKVHTWHHSEPHSQEIRSQLLAALVKYDEETAAEKILKRKGKRTKSEHKTIHHYPKKYPLNAVMLQLHSMRNPAWLQEFRWFVAYNSDNPDF
jgi:hypothetical protein